MVKPTTHSTNMTTIKLYGTAGACSLAAHILLNELDIPHEAVVTAIEAGITEQVKQLNPKKKVPVLVIDDQVITENVAILTTIAQLAPHRDLLGSTDLEKIRVLEYLAYLASTLHGQAYGGIFRPLRFTDDKSAVKSIQEKGIRNALECYEYIETSLKGVHAVGDQLTIVDPYLYVFWRWGSMFHPDMRTRFPKYAALVEELGKLESVRRTTKQEGIEMFLVE